MDHGPVARLDPSRFPARDEHRRSERDLAQDLALVRHYRLDRREDVAGLARRATTSPRAAQRLGVVLQPFREFHREYPMVVARDGFDGPIHLGDQVADGRRIGITTNDVNLHGTIVGPSGSGKTTVLLRTIAFLLSLRVLLAVFDTKRDFDRLLLRPDVLLIDEFTQWNPLEPVSFLSPTEARNEVIDEYLTRFYGADIQRQIITEAWEYAARERPAFSMADLADAVLRSAPARESPARLEQRRSTVSRLRRFEHYAFYRTRYGIPLRTILDNTFIVRAAGLDDVARWQYGLLTRYLYRDHVAHPPTTLRRVLVLDESYTLFANDQDGIRAIDPLIALKQVCREFKIGILNTTVSLNGLSDLARASTHLTIALPPNNHEEARAVIRVLGLNDEEADYYLHRLTIGEALLRIGQYPDIVHLRIPPNTEPKHISTAEVLEAQRRTNGHARPEVAAREECEGNGQPTPAHYPTPSSSPPSRVAPVVEEPKPTTTRVPLNKHVTAIINDVAEHPYTLTTPCFARCGLRLSEGDRARATLIELGYLESHRVRTGSGRGKTGNALRLTPAGWQWLGRTPTKGTKGGDSVQHAFTVHELHRRILRSTIETLGADLVISYNAAEHVGLLHALKTVSGRAIALNDGDVIALEIECSRPEITGPRNVSRNEGFALTIIATLHKQDELQQTIGGNDHVLIIDVLQLLDGLRP